MASKDSILTGGNDPSALFVGCEHINTPTCVDGVCPHYDVCNRQWKTELDAIFDALPGVTVTPS